jgi:hypothetical protein
MNAKSFNIYLISDLVWAKEIAGYNFLRRIGEVHRLYIFKCEIETIKTRLNHFLCIRLI